MATTNDLRNPKELKIPIVYGHIAAKKWGWDSKINVLALHGWLDNASSFDNLAAKLPSDWNLLAIDFPGNGLSSHLPLGMKYSFIQTLIDIRRVIKYLKWDRFHFLSHSFGGRYALLYASLYPKEVSSVVMIDFMYPGYIVDPYDPIDVAMENFFTEEKILERSPRRAQESVLQLYASKRNAPQKTVLQMFNRSFRQVESGKVIFTGDVRLNIKFQEDLTKPEQVFDMIRKHPLNVLVIKCDKGTILGRFPEFQAQTKEILQTNGGNFKLIEVIGDHYCHIVNPAVMATHIIDFITRFS